MLGDHNIVLFTSQVYFIKTTLILVKNENNQRKIDGTWQCSKNALRFLNFARKLRFVVSFILQCVDESVHVDRT